MRLDKQTAIRRLTNRWNEQVEKYPMMREEISLAVYISRNIAVTRRDCLLEKYETPRT